jgi:DNA-binding GntR family transcriptional regulator
MYMQVTPVSVADAVAGELRGRLLGGRYRGGDVLRDTEVAAEFGVARPTVRAAIAVLVAEGLLHRGRGRSAVVRSFTADDAIDLYRLRRPIEEAAVGLAIAGGASTERVAAAADAFSALPGGVAWAVVVAHDVAFHREVMVAAGSPRLLRTFDEASAELRLVIALLQPAYDRVADLAHEHQELLTALQSGDPARARAAWGAHFDESERFLVSLIRESAA